MRFLKCILQDAVAGGQVSTRDLRLKTRPLDMGNAAMAALSRHLGTDPSEQDIVYTRPVDFPTKTIGSLRIWQAVRPCSTEIYDDDRRKRHESAFFLAFRRY